MEQSLHIGNARREERMLLPALIELRGEYGDETLMADGLDVSASGLSMRAAFVPEVGTRLQCSFRCPPTDDAVSALGEVVWSSWDGPRSGSFGMRFLELDTKSATAIRRYVEPDAELPSAGAPPEAPRVALMRIDGLAAPIEADVKLLEKDCVVLEQELSFLRLGRGIEVDVPGRGKERGRIASIELRQGPLDTPTLVFGVLLDELSQPSFRSELSAPTIENVAPSAIAPSVKPKSAAGTLDEPFAEPARDAKVAARIAVQPPAPELAETAFAAQPVERAMERSHEVAREAVAALAHEHREPRASAARESVVPSPDTDDGLEEKLLQSRTPAVLTWLSGLLATLATLVRARMLPALAALPAQLGKARSALRSERSPFAAVLVNMARVRTLFAAQWAKLMRRRADNKRRTTAPSPRVQQQQPAKPVRVQQGRGAEARPRNRRLVTAALAVMGVGLGVYALAPRSGADRIRVPKQQQSAPSEPLAASQPVQPEAAPALSAPIVNVVPATGSTTAEAAAAAPVEQPVAIDKPSPRFGEAEVPNGRSFVLRMSGPVQSLEGEGREDGFTVRVPGRLALDRASPIATSHRAVARALILNRGEYAELTVEFLPGMRPKYQVTGKDNTIEVTLERL